MKQNLKVKLPFLIMLMLSAGTVSFIGATFSVTGLAKLFSGAPMAVMFMAGSLEMAKIVTAGFLHHNWKKLGWMLRMFLSFSVLVLMGITSIGIFGYLSHAYQKASIALNNTQIELDSKNREVSMVQADINRMQRAIDEIPITRLSKRTELQQQFEPEIQRLQRRSFELNSDIQKVMLERQGFQTEIGPLVYVADAFSVKMDRVARWFIFVFVCVFDPLAICLVFACSWSLHQLYEDEDDSAAPLSPKSKSAA